MIFIFGFFAGINYSCNKVNEISQDPEIEPLQHGFKVSATVGYCASLAHSLFSGEDLPANVVFHSESVDEYRASGFMFVNLNEQYPLPFNTSSGQLWMGCLWDPVDHTGIISAVFTEIDVLEKKFELIGIYTIPVMEAGNGNVMTVFAEQDIIVGQGSDTLFKISMTDPQFNDELDRLDIDVAEDVFAAVKQNVWIITADQNNTSTNVYDDVFTIYGGGQIVETRSSSGGILYHSLIGTVFIPDSCNLNPIEGIGFIQNFKVGTTLDLGNILLKFHNTCNGKAYVEFASGKFWASNRKYVNLNFTNPK